MDGAAWPSLSNPFQQCLHLRQHRLFVHGMRHAPAREQALDICDLDVSNNTSARDAVMKGGPQLCHVDV